MELFKTLFELMSEGAMVDMTIARKGDVLTVGIIPKVEAVKDSVLKNLPMMTVTGTAEELDKEYAQALRVPLAKTNKLFSNALAFEKNLEDIEATTAMKKAEEENVEKLMVKIGELEKKDPTNIEAFRKLLNPGFKKYPNNKRLLGKKAEYDAKAPVLFDVDKVEKVEPKVDTLDKYTNDEVVIKEKDPIISSSTVVEPEKKVEPAPATDKDGAFTMEI
tara:strand:- start:8573 stop:9229 length:657 start_codon:yes stop_codon:yes gene_type:complete